MLAALVEAETSLVAAQTAFRKRREILHVVAYERPIRIVREAIAKATGQ